MLFWLDACLVGSPSDLSVWRRLLLRMKLRLHHPKVCLCLRVVAWVIWLRNKAELARKRSSALICLRASKKGQLWLFFFHIYTTGPCSAFACLEQPKATVLNLRWDTEWEIHLTSDMQHSAMVWKANTTLLLLWWHGGFGVLCVYHVQHAQEPQHLPPFHLTRQSPSSAPTTLHDTSTAPHIQFRTDWRCRWQINECIIYSSISPPLSLSGLEMTLSSKVKIK